MTRKELANEVFKLLVNEKELNVKQWIIWQAIAETDDISLFSEYERLKNRGVESK